MITREEIENVTLLSKLSVTESELEKFRKDLEQMMEFAQSVAQSDAGDVNIDDITSFSPLRQDKVGASLTAEEVLSNTDTSCDGYFIVKNG